MTYLIKILTLMFITSATLAQSLSSGSLSNVSLQSCSKSGDKCLILVSSQGVSSQFATLIYFKDAQITYLDHGTKKEEIYKTTSSYYNPDVNELTIKNFKLKNKYVDIVFDMKTLNKKIFY